MAVKNHSLDNKITNAAFAEFMEYGFYKASLHKIAERANVTTGAIYTRYKNKDSLFCSLLEDVFSVFQTCAEPVAEKYYKAETSQSITDFLSAIEYEFKIYMDILFEHYDECILFFCKSDGSSIEMAIKKMIDYKIESTITFLEKTTQSKVNPNSIKLLMNSQFYFYRQLLESKYEKTEAISCMKIIEDFLISGWKNLYDQLQNQ